MTEFDSMGEPMPEAILPGDIFMEPEMQWNPTFTKVVSAIAAVMGEIGEVEKKGNNAYQNYKYARMQDVLAALTPLLAKHGVVVMQNEVEQRFIAEDRVLAVTFEFTLVHVSGEMWPWKVRQTGYSVAITSNGHFDDKCYNKCHTSARKYFLMGQFQIPSADVVDADAEDGATPAVRRQRRTTEPPARTPEPPVKAWEPATAKERILVALASVTKKADYDQWRSDYLGLIKALAPEDKKFVSDRAAALVMKLEQENPVVGVEKALPPDGDKSPRVQTPLTAGPIPGPFDGEQWLANLKEGFADANTLDEVDEVWQRVGESAIEFRKNMFPPDRAEAEKMYSDARRRVEKK